MDGKRTRKIWGGINHPLKKREVRRHRRTVTGSIPSISVELDLISSVVADGGRRSIPRTGAYLRATQLAAGRSFIFGRGSSKGARAMHGQKMSPAQAS